jgi:hypothetical protein
LTRTAMATSLMSSFSLLSKADLRPLNLRAGYR